MKQRLTYVDNLKAAMVALVILHHTAITYGGSGSWYYVEQSDEFVSKILLTMFAVINQTFFMGVLFLISGYFTPGSYDRKGAFKFLKDRLIRLGIPIILFAVCIDPVLRYILGGETASVFTEYYLQKLSQLDLNMGPL